MAWSFFKKRDVPFVTGPVLVLDVRSSSVGGAIVEFSKHKPPVVIRSHREHYFFDAVVESDVFFNRAESATKTVLDTLLNKKFHHKSISSIEIFFGAPWYQSSIVNTKIEQATPTECTSDFIENIIKNDTSFNDKEEVRVEKELISTFLNGYRIQTPLGKKATHFDLSFFNSVIAKETLDNFVKIISKYIKIQAVHVHTHPYAMFKVLNETLHAPKHYAVLDVSGEILEISIIKDDHFQKIVSIPFGSHYFMRAYAKMLSTDFKSAFIKLKSIVHSETDSNTKLNQGWFLKEVQADMARAIQKVFAENKIELIPNVIFVTGDEEVKEIILYLLNQVEIYAGALKINRKPEVQFVASDILKNYCTYSSQEHPDHQLSAEAVFVELLRVDKQKI